MVLSACNSIGVVTINMARIAYLSKSEAEFIERLDRLMLLAKNSLEVKRKALERLTNEGLFPYSVFYLKTVKQRFKSYWANHFSTIGLIGMNEACLNLSGVGIDTEAGRELSLRILQYMKKRLEEFQDETGNLYNLEATPGEGASYRLAKLDKSRFPQLITSGKDGSYYTNSTQLPVNFSGDLFEALALQDKLQQQYTGGTVFHCFLGERIDDPAMARDLLMKVSQNFRLPYFTLTPTFSICPEHGYIRGEVAECLTCGAATEIYSRIVGYFRPVSQWNKGKVAEFSERKLFKPELRDNEDISDGDLRNEGHFPDRLSGQDCGSDLYEGCNFRCPFCHNSSLVLGTNSETLSSADVLRDIERRKGFIDGVVITGGEPAINEDLPGFIREIRKRGLAVKLDTNGSHPEMLQKLIESRLVDFVSMDIKTTWPKYKLATGSDADIEILKKSIGLIKSSNIDYEFRTTCVPTLVNAEDIDAISRISGSRGLYTLQQFQPEDAFSEEYRRITPYSFAALHSLLEIACANAPGSRLIGI